VSRTRDRLLVMMEPLALLLVAVGASWWVYVDGRHRWSWADLHYDDIHTALFLYVPLVPILLSRRATGRLDLAAWGLAPGGLGRSLGVWLATTAVVAPAFAAFWWLASHHGPPWFRPGFEAHIPQNLAHVAFFQLVQVALPEEFFFRAYAQSRLNQVWTGRVSILGARVGWALPAAAALFALAHPLLAGPLVARSWARLETFFPGLLFGWLRERTGSVAAPVLMHWTSNLLLFALSPGT
jgi:membrane protease YdiL (CAAX protease family)